MYGEILRVSFDVLIVKLTGMDCAEVMQKAASQDAMNADVVIFIDEFPPVI